MRRTAAYFGVWIALCMLVQIVVMFSVFFPRVFFLPDRPNQWLFAVRYFGPYGVPVGIVAGIGWWLLHRGGRRPGWLVYVLFALAVVLVNHVLIVGFLQMLSSPGDFDALWFTLALTLVMHGWLTVPAAVVGTYLFVAWNRRRGAGV